MNYAVWQGFPFWVRMETSVSPVSFHKVKVKTDFLKSLKSTECRHSMDSDRSFFLLKADVRIVVSLLGNFFCCHVYEGKVPQNHQLGVNCMNEQKQIWMCKWIFLSGLSVDCSGGSDLTMSPEERVPMRRSSTREQDHRSGGTCFLLAASDYTCPADGGIRKTGSLTDM